MTVIALPLGKRMSLLGSVAAVGLLGGSVHAAADAGAPVVITISNTGCSPASVTVPPGKTTFKIKNDSQRKVEWEILKGVMVVEERENIIPGFVQTLTATLDSGAYQMTCGLLSNPKGVLTVAASDAPIGPHASIAHRTTVLADAVDTDGTQTIAGPLRPLIDKRDSGLDARVLADFVQVDALLAQGKARPDGFAGDKPTERDRTGPKVPVTVLADDLSIFSGARGVD